MASMRLPGGDRAFVDPAKLTEYCLDPSHPRGRHKARVFRSALGITLANAEVLHRALIDSASSADAEAGEVDGYGSRYLIRFELETSSGRATVVSAWIIRTGEDFPRFVTCFVE